MHSSDGTQPRRRGGGPTPLRMAPGLRTRATIDSGNHERATGLPSQDLTILTTDFATNTPSRDPTDRMARATRDTQTHAPNPARVGQRTRDSRIRGARLEGQFIISFPCQIELALHDGTFFVALLSCAGPLSNHRLRTGSVSRSVRIRHFTSRVAHRGAIGHHTGN